MKTEYSSIKNKILNKEYDNIVTKMSQHWDFYKTDEYRDLPPFQRMIYQAEDSILYKYLDMLRSQIRYVKKLPEKGGSFHDFDFSVALILLRRGACLTRRSWNDWELDYNDRLPSHIIRKYLTYCSLDSLSSAVDNSIIHMTKEDLDDIKSLTEKKKQEELDGNNDINIFKNQLYCIEINSFQGKDISVWTPISEDIINDDWYLINSDESISKRNNRI